MTLTFEENILFGGFLAKLYAESDYNSPIHSWAANIPNRQLVVGNTTYTFGPGRRIIDGHETNVIQLTKETGPYNNKVQENFFFAVEDLRKVSFTIKGYTF